MEEENRKRSSDSIKQTRRQQDKATDEAAARNAAPMTGLPSTTTPVSVVVVEVVKVVVVVVGVVVLVMSSIIMMMMLLLLTSSSSSSSSNHGIYFVQAFSVAVPGTTRMFGRSKSTVASSLRMAEKKPNDDDDDDGSSVGGRSAGGKVMVNVTREIVCTSPSPSKLQSSSSSQSLYTECIEAWFEQHWNRGGGLPIFVDCDDDGTRDSSRRTIYPIGMEEAITSINNTHTPPRVDHDRDDNNDDDSNNDDLDDASPAVLSAPTIHYTVTKPGPFLSRHMLPNSHTGQVSFVPSYQMTSDNDNDNDKTKIMMTAMTMIWEVEFEVTKFRTLYQLLTQLTINVASTTVQESLQPVRVLNVECDCEIPLPASTCNYNNAQLRQVETELLNFFWSSRGGGLLLPPPIPFGEKLYTMSSSSSENSSSTEQQQQRQLIRRKLLRIPPIIVESIVSTTATGGTSTVTKPTKNTTEFSEIVYQLENPGWLTFPFLLHTHIGRIQILPLLQQSASSSSSSGGDTNNTSATTITGTTTTTRSTANYVLLRWQVEIRSYFQSIPILSSFVPQIIETLVEMTVTTIVRNFLREQHMMIQEEDPTDNTAAAAEVLKVGMSQSTTSVTDDDDDDGGNNNNNGGRTKLKSWWSTKA